MTAPLPPLRKRLKRAARYPFVAALFRLAQLLPFRFALWLGARLGRLAFAFLPSQRRLALEHLTIAFPELSESDRLALAGRCFEELGRCGLEVCQARKLDRRLATYVHWPDDDIAAVRAALAEGKGGVFVTAHVGNWELLARRIASAGFDHAVVVRDSSDPRLAALVERFRAGGSVRTVGRGTGSGPLREMLSAFRRGALLALLIDQSTHVQGLVVPFFGQPAYTPRAAEDLARRSGAPVIAGFIHRRPEGGHTLRTERVETVPGEAEGALTARLTARIEREIRAHPSDWVWMHRRWRLPRPSVQTLDNIVDISQ